jgi:hypothetical protein
MRYIIGMLLLPIGIAVGLSLPDIDHELGFLVHRSLVTHGCLFPFLAFWVAYKRENPMTRLFSMGFSVSSAAHLSFDLFPRAWTGFALIHIPLYGRISPLFSWLWIAGSIAICLYLALSLTRNLLDVVASSGSLAVSFGFCLTTGNTFWLPLVALVLATAIALMLPADPNAMLKKLLREKVSKNWRC